MFFFEVYRKSAIEKLFFFSHLHFAAHNAQSHAISLVQIEDPALFLEKGENWIFSNK